MSHFFRSPRETDPEPRRKRRRLSPPTSKGILRQPRRLTPRATIVKDSLPARSDAFVVVSSPVAAGPLTNTSSTQSTAPSDVEKTGEDGKRVLRSNGGPSRCRSDLAQFFPEYDDYVFGEERPRELINAETIFFLVDNRADKEAAEPFAGRTQNTPDIGSKLQSKQLLDDGRAGSYFPRYDFGGYTHAASIARLDPLSDTVFLQAHRRGERKEKQLRNIEKERAMHEKGDLERLLEELKGPDWLKTMGITGIVDTDKKHFEPKRLYYLKAVQTLLDKFASWREQERSLKSKLDQLVSKRVDSSDMSASKLRRKKDKLLIFQNPEHARTASVLDSELHGPEAFLQPDPKEPFTSFFSKPYERAAAVGQHRRGRANFAFGHPLPDPEEKDFSLPISFDAQLYKSNARKKRRLKRDI